LKILVNNVSISSLQGVCFHGLNFSLVTSDVQILISRIKHELIIKLIIQMETNLRDESIKPN